MTNNMTTLDPKELLDQFRDDHKGLVAALEAALPKPTYPEHLFDLRAKHPELGEVVCIWDKPGSAGGVLVRWRDESDKVGSRGDIVPVSSLKFPHQATKPEDVPVGEAWLVDVNDGEHIAERVVALKKAFDHWYTADGVVDSEEWWDSEVTLIAPLVPATPAPEPEHPATLSSVEDYAAAPVGTVVAEPGKCAWTKVFDSEWRVGDILWTNRNMAGTERQVLRKGWGNE